MGSILRIVHDLCDIIRVCTVYDDDIAPPFFEVGRDLVIFRLRLVVPLDHLPSTPELLAHKSLVGVVLHVDG